MMYMSIVSIFISYISVYYFMIVVNCGIAVVKIVSYAPTIVKIIRWTAKQVNWFCRKK